MAKQNWDCKGECSLIPNNRRANHTLVPIYWNTMDWWVYLMEVKLLMPENGFRTVTDGNGSQLMVYIASHSNQIENLHLHDWGINFSGQTFYSKMQFNGGINWQWPFVLFCFNKFLKLFIHALSMFVWAPPPLNLIAHEVPAQFYFKLCLSLNLSH